MSDKPSRWCVLMPCSHAESWAVPQNCLAEIVTLHAVDAHPPPEISWRGQIYMNGGAEMRSSFIFCVLDF